MSFEITVDGRPLPVEPGQTIAAVLHTGGMPAWRRTRVGDAPRGLFCGIGVCFDCLVMVNGRRSVRACLVEAQPGDAVSTDLGTGSEAGCR
jgi:hypothetical protein